MLSLPGIFKEKTCLPFSEEIVQYFSICIIDSEFVFHDNIINRQIHCHCICQETSNKFNMEKMLDYFFYYSIWIFSLSLPFFYLEAALIGFLMVYINTAVAIAAITLSIRYINVNKLLQDQQEKRNEMTSTRTTETKMINVKGKF